MFAGEVEAPKIGRYTILRLIGEGGMGTVYACFDDQLDRQVALKLVRGIAGAEARTRMLREAQAMAKLSHPNVVPVFEVGEHETQLFVAMEYVRGRTLEQWQEEQKPGWPLVLGMYIQAGRGLAAAHAQRLVHRDFKPHNAIVGADGRVRVLDFGLAARQGDLQFTTAQSTELPSPKEGALDTPLTATGAVMGTPAYMAPEQFSAQEADHRSDQFSFCVALWEALFGKRPFDGGDSRFLSRMRSGDFTAVGKTEVPPAVQTVLKRGLEAEPSRRWPDVDTLLAELERVTRRSGQARRLRRAVLGGTVGGAVLVGAVVLGGQELDRIQTRACEVAAGEELDRTWNDETRAAVRDGLLASGSVLADSAAQRSLPWLDRYAQDWRETYIEACTAVSVREQRSDDDLERSRWCLEQRGMALGALVGQLRDADRIVVQTAVTAAAQLPPVATCGDWALLSRLSGPPPADQRAVVSEIQMQLLDARALRFTSQYASGIGVARDAIERAGRADRPGLRAAGLLEMGLLLEADAQFEDAASTLEDAYFDAVEVGDYETASSAAWSLVELAGRTMAEPKTGRRWARHGRAANHQLGRGDDHPSVADGLMKLAYVTQSFDLVEAEDLYRQALAVRMAALGPDHPALAATLARLASVHYVRRRFAKAKEEHQRALAIRIQALGGDHPEVANSLDSLAKAHAALGAYDEARPLHERALAIREAALRVDHPDVADSLNQLANVLAATGAFDEARPLYERALAIREQTLRSNHPSLANSLNNLGTVLTELGEYERAEQLHRRAVTIKEEFGGKDHPDVANSLDDLAATHRRAGAFDEAVAALNQGLQIREAAWGGSDSAVGLSLGQLGAVLVEAGRSDEAMVAFNRARQIFDGEDGVQDGEPEARFGGAALMLARGGDRLQAIALAEEARAQAVEKGVLGAETVSAIDGWLGRLGSPQLPY